MINWKIAVFAFVFNSLLFQGCTTNYIPMVANTPMLSQLGETQGSLHAGSGGYSLQLSHTPVFHWGFAGGGSINTVVVDTNKAYNYKNISGEAATGFYTRLSRTARFEVYGGIGKGSAGTSISRWHMNRFFLQPSIGISTPIIDLAFTPRFSFVDHYETEESGSATDISNDNVFFFEPSVTARAGFNEFKFSFQWGLAFALSNQDTPLAENFKPSYVAIGIHLCFGKDYDRYD